MAFYRSYHKLGQLCAYTATVNGTPVPTIVKFQEDINKITFNLPVVIGNNVSYCTNFFLGFTNFNQPITIPDSVISTLRMFYGCTNYGQNTIVPNNVIYGNEMFAGCNASLNIVIYSPHVRNWINVVSAYNNQNRKNVYAPSANPQNIATHVDLKNASNWRNNGVCWYNTLHNIYVYKDLNLIPDDF